MKFGVRVRVRPRARARATVRARARAGYLATEEGVALLLDVKVDDGRELRLEELQPQT